MSAGIDAATDADRDPPPLPLSAQALALLQARARTALGTPAAAGPVASPCISICRMNDDRSLCLGCWRTLDEIRVWSRAEAPERRAIWQQLLARAGIAAP